MAYGYPFLLVQIIALCSNLDFNNTYKKFLASNDFKVQLDRDPYGNFTGRMRVDHKVCVQGSTHGKISVWYPTNRGSLFWYKVWARVQPNLCSRGGEEVGWKILRAQDIGGRKMPNPEHELAYHILGLESLGELPPDHLMMPHHPSKELVEYYAMFNKAALDWDSEFPPPVDER